MPYKLKEDQPDFELVDGPFAGRKFEAGKTYPDVPKEHADRFDVLPAEKKAASKGGTK